MSLANLVSSNYLHLGLNAILPDFDTEISPMFQDSYMSGCLVGEQCLNAYDLPKTSTVAPTALRGNRRHHLSFPFIDIQGYKFRDVDRIRAMRVVRNEP
jgi:hypothetical protein